MYAHVKDGGVDYLGELPKNWDNVSNLHLSNGDDAYLKTIGWLPLVETTVTPTYNQVFDTDVITVEADRVLLIHRARDMTAEEKTERDESHMGHLRRVRNEALAATDFYALSDVDMTEEMKTHRQALRDLPETADMTTWPDSFTWLTNPED